jgi:hypothetical protein
MTFHFHILMHLYKENLLRHDWTIVWVLIPTFIYFALHFANPVWMKNCTISMQTMSLWKGRISIFHKLWLSQSFFTWLLYTTAWAILLSFSLTVIEIVVCHNIFSNSGYMAPEYAMEGLFSIKSDVYNFGVLLLEIICGKKNSSFYHSERAQSLLSYVVLSSLSISWAQIWGFFFLIL